MTDPDGKATPGFFWAVGLPKQTFRLTDLHDG